MFSFDEVLTRITDSPYKYSVLLRTKTTTGSHFTPMVYESADKIGGEGVVEQRDDGQRNATTQESTAAGLVAAEAQDNDELTEGIDSDEEDLPVAAKEWNRYVRLIRNQLGECEKMMLTMCHTHT